MNTKKTTGTLPGSNMSGGSNLRVGMNLFGLPHQFLPSTDQRHPSISNTVGRKFVDNIILDSAIVTIIPGEPRYLPGVRDKIGWTNALINAANGNFDDLKNLNGGTDEQLKLYEFQSAYMKFFGYVNVVARTAAGYLDLTDTGYQINGKNVNFLNFDWKNYRWDNQQYHSMISKIGQSILGRISFADESAGRSNDELDPIENSQWNTNYIQFYVDSDASQGSESLSNNTQPSMFKSALDQGTNGMRDLAFVAGSGGVDTSKLTELGESAMNALNGVITGGDGIADGTVGTVLSRLLSVGKNVIKGENIIMPDIYAGSNNSKSYSLTLKFRAPYGNRVTNYVEAIVPMLYCLCLAYPRGTTANSYGSPPLVKVYKRGEWTCNLGIVSGIEIRTENENGFSVDNTPLEITVTLNITDLYSDVALTPPNDPLMFASNSSLVEFLATTCGLDLVQPQLSKKVENIWNTTVNNFKGIPSTAFGKVTESLDRAAASLFSL